jgi:DNA-3-methyladenine glycosylase II
MSRIFLRLKAIPPFRLDLTVWALRRMPHNSIDRWNGNVYTRAFVLDQTPIKVEVYQQGTITKPVLSVVVSSRKVISDVDMKSAISSRLEKMLGIRMDVREFYALTAGDRRLKPLTDQFMGVKPPRFQTVFEALVNAFACQQLSLNVGITLLNRLTEKYGKAFVQNGKTIHAFPEPEDLGRATHADLRKLGFSHQKGEAIVEVTRDILEEKVNVESLEAMNDNDAFDFLLTLKGIGRWSAEYVLLRGLGRINIIPADDVGAQNKLQQFLRLKNTPDYERIKRITLRWKPYAGFLYFHFLLKRLAEKGYLL